MSKPITTRLRFVSAASPERIVEYLDRLPYRVQIYGAPVWNGRRWFLWFVPPDNVALVMKSVNL